MEKELTLKPCPFCGGKNFEITDKDTFYMLQGEHGMAALSMRCKDCWAQMWEHTFENKVYFARLVLLAKKWNRRA